MTSHRCELPAPVVLGRYNLVEGAYWQASEASIRPLSTCIRTNGRFVTPLRALDHRGWGAAYRVAHSAGRAGKRIAPFVECG